MNYPEINEAVKKVIEARADITCCVNFNEDDKDNADWLYHQCKKYIEEYEENKNRIREY